ncbi:MAG: nucleotidyltransferase family protein [Actinomycetota bacterium]
MSEASAIALSRRIAGYGLPGGGDDPGPLLATWDGWEPLRDVLAEQHLTGFALGAIRDGWLHVLPEQAAELLGHHRAAMLWDLALERKLMALADAFDGAGLGFVVLKGSALAHCFYPDPSWRSFGDLDLLVRTRDWQRACELLEALAFHRDLPEPRPGFDVRFGKAANHTDGDGLLVDLHRTLVPGPFGLWMDSNELFDRTTEFRLGGRILRRLDDTATFLHACVHASLGAWPPLLLPLRDVVQVARFGTIDWESLAAVTERWHLRSVMRHALRSATETLRVGLPEEADALVAVEPSTRERRVLEAYTTGRRGRGGTALTVIRCIPGIKARASYVRALLVPDREFLAARGERGGSPPSYFQRWLKPVRWLSGKRYRG